MWMRAPVGSPSRPTTQFAIRDVGLYRPVLEAAAETAATWTERPVMMVAGVVGCTAQAVAEARAARALGYHAVLLSLAALKGASEEELLGHCRTVAAEMPVIGFYLQPAVGGIALSTTFWKRFAAIDNVIGIKVAPFNRYATLDVLRGVAAAGAGARISLYTGNDDHIVLDLLVPFRVGATTLHFAGGLLGHWSVWTRSAVALLQRCKEARQRGVAPAELLALDSAVTDCNAAFFDVANGFHGVIGMPRGAAAPGTRRGRWCSIRQRTSVPARAKPSTGSIASIQSLTTTRSWPPISSWLAG